MAVWSVLCCLCVSPPVSLDQLKSVSHLQGTVLMYRVSEVVFFWFIPSCSRDYQWSFVPFYRELSGFLTSSFSPLLSPPGSEHADLRPVLLRLPFLLLWLLLLLLLSPTFLLQRWAPLLPLPLPAKVRQTLQTPAQQENIRILHRTCKNTAGHPPVFDWLIDWLSICACSKLLKSLLSSHVSTRHYAPKARRRESGTHSKKLKTQWGEDEFSSFLFCQRWMHKHTKNSSLKRLWRCETETQAGNVCRSSFTARHCCTLTVLPLFLVWHRQNFLCTAAVTELAGLQTLSAAHVMLGWIRQHRTTGRNVHLLDSALYAHIRVLCLEGELEPWCSL